MNSSNKSNEEQAKTSQANCAFENLKIDYFFQRLFSWIIKRDFSKYLITINHSKKAQNKFLRLWRILLLLFIDRNRIKNCRK